MAKYTAANVVGKAFTGNMKIAFDILEDGIAIAHVTRGATRDGWIMDFKFKFYTDASKRRFENWCDSITMSEACEALLYSRD